MRDVCWASARTVQSGRPVMTGDSGRATQGRPPRMRGNCTGGAGRGSFGLWPLCSFLVGPGEWMEGWGQDQVELLAFGGGLCWGGGVALGGGEAASACLVAPGCLSLAAGLLHRDALALSPLSCCGHLSSRFSSSSPGLACSRLIRSLLCLLQSSLMDLADVFTAPAPPPASDPWGGPAPISASTSDPWGGPPVPPAADPWGGPAPTPASGDPWRPAAPAGPPVDPWGGTQPPAAGEGPTPDPWGSSDGECWLPACSSLHIQCAVQGMPWGQGQIQSSG